VLGFGSAQELKTHYEHVRAFDPRNVYLFERARLSEDAEDAVRLRRAWARIAPSTIRALPSTGPTECYFVCIAEVRPRLAITDHGTVSFLRAMRRAGLKRPKRVAFSDERVRDRWLDYVRLLREACDADGVFSRPPAGPAAAPIPAAASVVSVPLPSSPPEASFASASAVPLPVSSPPVSMPFSSDDDQHASLSSPAGSSAAELSCDELETICREVFASLPPEDCPLFEDFSI